MAIASNPFSLSNALTLVAVVVFLSTLTGCRDAKDACQRQLEEGNSSSCPVPGPHSAEVMACRMGVEEFAAQMTLDTSAIPNAADAERRCETLCSERYAAGNIVLGDNMDGGFNDNPNCVGDLLAVCKTSCTASVALERQAEECRNGGCDYDYPVP